MKYKRNKFTEEEIAQIESIGRIVCYVFGIDEDDLRGRCRKRAISDARKVTASCASILIKVGCSHVFESPSYNNVAIASWYLNVDHSTASYSVNKASDLYNTDDEFRCLYDCVMTIINNPDEETLENINTKAWHEELTWEEVRSNKIFKERVRMSLSPQEVIDGICDLYRRGYGGALISSKYKVLSSFVNYVIREKKVSREVRGSSFIDASKLIARRNAIVKSAPKSNVLHKSDY